MLRADSAPRTVIVEGARQVGKSYLVAETLRELGRPYQAHDLEKNRALRRQIERTESFEDFRALMTDRYGVRPGTILYLDEAQECRKLAEYVKSFTEDWHETQVILTGSSMRRLFGAGVRVPVGRTRSLLVLPFSFPEFLRCGGYDELARFVCSAPGEVVRSRHDTLLELYDRYLLVGGYPEAVKAYWRGEEYRVVLEEILAQLSEDFERKEQLEPWLFEEALRAVADNLAMPAKLTQVETTKYRAREVIAKMKRWHLVIEVEHRAFDPRHSRFLPKRYLHDIGIVNMKRSLAAPEISLAGTLSPVLRTPLGGTIENAVLLSLLENESAVKEITTWKRGGPNSVEVDFVFDYAAQRCKIPIEVKAALTSNSRHATNLRHYLRESAQRFGVVVSAAPLHVQSGDECSIVNIPAYLCTKSNIQAYCDRFRAEA